MSGLDSLSQTTVWSARPAAARALKADVVPSWEAARTRWSRLADRGEALAFQRLAWLDAWYQHCTGPGREPAIVFLHDADGGRDVLGLALVRSREGWKSVVSFADDGLTDYNAPVIGAGFRDDEAPLVWRALRNALAPAHVVRFMKMPVAIGTRANPLVSLPGTAPSTLIGNILLVPGTWDEWHWGLERTFRKELERASRVFEKNAGARFERYEAGPAASRVYAELKRLQAARIAELGLPYRLDDEPARAFYDSIVEDGLRDGTAVLTALTIEDEVVAALLGITDGMHFAMTRLATPGPQWKNFSPGRLIIERTMKMLHAEGYRAFDFTIGDYSYKRRIGVTPVPMVETVLALSPLGWAEVAQARGKAMLKRHPGLQRLRERLHLTKAEPQLF